MSLGQIEPRVRFEFPYHVGLFQMETAGLQVTAFEFSVMTANAVPECLV